MKAYNGHKSWNYWNVSLWLNNDYGLYQYMVHLVREYGKGKAAELMAEELAGTKTPDGATYNKTAIRAAMAGL